MVWRLTALSRKDEKAPKRLSTTRRKHATPSLPLQAVKSESRPTPATATEPGTAPSTRKQGPFIHEDDEDDVDQMPWPVAASEPDAPAPLTNASIEEHVQTSTVSTHPVLKELSPNLSPQKNSQSKQDLHSSLDDGQVTAAEPGVASKSRQASPQKQVEAPLARPQQELTASLASLLQQQKAVRSDSTGSDPPLRRKDRPLGRSASSIANRSASASAHSDHNGSPPVVNDMSDSVADGFSFAKEPPPPPATQLGYETADAEQHRLLMEKRMRVKLQDERAGTRLASVGTVKDAVDNTSVGNRTRGRNRTK